MIKRHLPLMITLLVFVAGYLFCLSQFPGFASTRVICNILTDNAFLGIIAVGMTFVILSGGIDLSVGAVIAFTGVFLARAIGDFHIDPLLAFALILSLGALFGAMMGWLIDALKIPAFIITLAGMFSCADAVIWCRRTQFLSIIRSTACFPVWRGKCRAVGVSACWR